MQNLVIGCVLFGVAIGTILMMQRQRRPVELPLDRERALFQFNSNEKALTDKPMMSVEVEEFGLHSYYTIASLVQENVELAQRNLAQIVLDSLDICAKHHGFFHLEVFDNLQICFHGIVLLRVRNNASNSGVSVSFRAPAPRLEN